MSRLAVALLIGVLSTAGLAQGPIASHAPAAPATATPAAPATAAPALPPSAVVAHVNGVALTQADLTEKEQVIFPYFRQHNGSIPASAEAEVRSMAMQRLVLDELVYQEAKRRNLKLPEVQLQKGMRDLRQQFGSPQAYAAAVDKKYGSEAAFQRTIRRNLLIRKLWNSEVTSKAVVTPVELRAYYVKNQSRFIRPEAVSIQSISFLLPKDATPLQKQQVRKKAEDILPKAQAAKNYEEFGVLAEQVSEDEWRVMMGDHKWTHRGEVDPQFEPIFKMKAGETTGVVESAEGFHILRVNEHQLKRQMTFAEMRDQLRKTMETHRRTERAEALERTLKKNAKIMM